MGNDESKKALGDSPNATGDGFLNRWSAVQVGPGAPNEAPRKQDFREAVTLLHREARESLTRMREDAEVVANGGDFAPEAFFRDAEAVQAALDELLTQLVFFVGTSPSDEQIADAREALKRVGTSGELGSDRPVIDATLRGTRLDDPDLGMTAPPRKKNACGVEGCGRDGTIIEMRKCDGALESTRWCHTHFAELELARGARGS